MKTRHNISLPPIAEPDPGLDPEVQWALELTGDTWSPSEDRMRRFIQSSGQSYNNINELILESLSSYLEMGPDLLEEVTAWIRSKLATDSASRFAFSCERVNSHIGSAIDPEMFRFAYRIEINIDGLQWLGWEWNSGYATACERSLSYSSPSIISEMPLDLDGFAAWAILRFYNNEMLNPEWTEILNSWLKAK
jgi:hypothetical protein